MLEFLLLALAFSITASTQRSLLMNVLDESSELFSKELAQELKERLYKAQIAVAREESIKKLNELDVRLPEKSNRRRRRQRRLWYSGRASTSYQNPV